MARGAHALGESVRAVYGAAALGEPSWPQALEILAAELGGRCLCLAAEDRRSATHRRWQVGTPLRDACRSEAADLPVGPEGGAGQARARPVAAQRCHSYALPSAAGSAARLCIALQPRRRDAALDARLCAILPDLAVALRIHLARAAHAPDPVLLAICLDRVPRALIALDGKRRVRTANAAARRLLEERDGLEIRGGALHAMRPGDDASLRALVRSAGRPEAPAALAVPRPSGRRPYCVQARPLREAASGDGPVTLLLIADPEARPCPAEAVLASLFALTPTEARLAARLARGETIGVAASALGIGEKTARLHLEHVMRKTGVHRQGALVSLLLAAGAHWWPLPPRARRARRARPAWPTDAS